MTGAKEPEQGIRRAHEEPHEEEAAVLGQEQAHAEPSDQGPHHRAEHVVDDQYPDWKRLVHQPAGSVSPSRERGVPNRPSSRFAAGGRECNAGEFDGGSHLEAPAAAERYRRE